MKKVLTSFLAFTIAFTETLFFLPQVSAESLPLIGGNTAYAESTDNNNIKDLYDLVALVVDTKLMDDRNTYVGGLTSQYAIKLQGASDMPSRIKRFAKDLQKDSPKTIVKVLTYDEEKETLLDVISSLENLYKNGDENVNSRLRGVVLIGNVPLPVVNKNGNRFISMFPLTDFDDKAYVYNPSTQSFDLNTAVVLQKPEIWHGVLRHNDTNRLAEFFDKNHLYHEGEKDFATFGQKLFFGDFVSEEKDLNEDEYTLYQNLITKIDDIAYMRFNKSWAAEVANNVIKSANIDVAEVFKGAGGTNETDGDTNEALEANMEAMPDIYTRTQIMSYYKDYVSLVSGFLGESNDLTSATARYNPQEGGVDYVPALITMKDKFSTQYLRQANDAIENKVNEIVREIAQPLPIVGETAVWGTVGGESFSLLSLPKSTDFISDLFALVGTPEIVPLPYVYKNLMVTGDEDGDKEDEFYINGVSSDFLTTPKLCLPYLGSTKTTRALSSDNMVAAANSYTLGINTFALGASEAWEKTDNKFKYGLIIEDTPEYGVPAFYNNSKLKNQLEKGDIILGIRPVYKMAITFPSYTVSQDDIDTFGEDIEKIATTSDPFIASSDLLNDGNKTSYQPLIKCDNCKEYDDLKRPDLEATGVPDGYVDSQINKAIWNGVKEENITILPYAVKSGENYYYLPSSYEVVPDLTLMKSNTSMKNVVNTFAQNVGNPNNGGSDKDEIYWDKYSYLEISYFDSSSESEKKESEKQEDVFFDDLSPYSNLSSDNKAYSINGGSNWLSGCFFTSTVMHDDRCLPTFAKYPVLDPAGSIEPFLKANTGLLMQDNKGIYSYYAGAIPEKDDPKLDGKKEVYRHQFPIGKKVIEDDGETIDFKKHAEVFQLPETITKENLSDSIDDMYMDACYNMLPDINSGLLGPGVFYKDDFYGIFNRTAEEFVGGEGRKNQNLPFGGGDDNIELYDTTSDMILNHPNYGVIPITLANFATHYGLYDGIDNDEDGFTDFEEVKNAENKVTGFRLDLHEADSQYGIDPNNIPAVSRALLGVRYNWTNPTFQNGTPEAGEFWYPLPINYYFISQADGHQLFDEDSGIILKVKPTVKSYIPSLIVHNEPTNYTISKQIESGITPSLPIDDPRYVAFMDPKGQTQKITYPNLLESTVTATAPDIAQFQIDIDVLADSILKIPGAKEKLETLNNGGSAKDYIKKQLFDVTLNSAEPEYTDKNHTDYMLSADAKILRDALKWSTLSIDDKHEYVLDYYLNDGANYQPYINDSGTGYETAYLLFDGGSKTASDYIDFSFNKGTVTDGDPEFDPFYNEVTYEEFVGKGIDKEGYPEDESDGDEFVSLKKFFEELISFFKDIGKLVTSFDPKVGLQFACGDDEYDCVSEKDVTEDTCNDTLTEIKLVPSKSIVYSDGEDYVDVQITAYNQDEKIFTASTPALTYSVSQDVLNPSFVIDNNYSSQALRSGVGVVRLRSTKISGSVTLSVQAVVSNNGTDEATTIDSEGLLIQSSGKRISLTSDTAGAQIDTDETITLSAGLMANDELEGNATNQVTFTILEGKDYAVFDGANIVNAENGLAEAVIIPLTKSGMIKVEAKVTDGPFYATEVKELFIGSGEPTKIGLVLDTDVLIANQKSKANVVARVLDKYGNLTADQLSSVSIFAFGDVKLDMTGDKNSLMPGLQLDTTDGVANASILSGGTIGEASVYAVLMTDEVEDRMITAAIDEEGIDFKGGIGSSKKISILGDGSLKLTPKYNEKINADGVAVSNISVDLMQTNGAKVSGYNGEIVWNLNDKTYGSLKSATGNSMKSGSSSAIFQSTTVSGKPTITVTAPGFAEIAFAIETLPGSATSLSLVSDKETLFTGGADTTSVKAKLLDQYGNLAYTSSANVSFIPSKSSDGMWTFNGDSDSLTLNGFANANIKSTTKSGKGAMVATAPGLEQGSLNIDFKKRISNETSNNFQKFSPRALYINLLGGAFYDLGINDLASEMLFSGKSQAILTTTAVLNDKKRVLSVDAFGQVNILDTNVKSNFVPATETFPFNKIKFKDETFGIDVGEAFFVPKDGLDFGLITDDFVNHKEGIFVKDITPSDKKDLAPKLITDVTTNSILLKRGVTDLAKIDKYGRVSVLSNDVVLRLPQIADKGKNLDQSYFSMLLEWKTISIAQIQFRQSVSFPRIEPTDTSSAFEAGIYVKLANSNGNFAKIDSFSRYSTEFKRGVYIIDTTQGIDRNMAPGSGIDSIESATENPAVGFSADNKNILLFAAGNSVGESNLPYASESGIVLGDPTVRIDNTTTGNADRDLLGVSNYTHDIGQMIHSDAEPFDNVESFDYNGDGYDDLLITFADGRIKLLENENSNQRFSDRGIVLNIPNKINSLSKLDINQDGFDDLIIGTQESCIQGEKCLYLYTNKNGNFERQKLELNTADKILSVKTADLDGDKDEDLVIADGAGNVYVFWVDDGKVNPKEYKLGNFGINLNSTELIDDILVNYGSMPAMPAITSKSLAEQDLYRQFVQIKITQEDLATDASAIANMFGDNYTYNPDPLVNKIPLIKPLPFLLTKYTNGVLEESTKKVANLTADKEGRQAMAVGDIIEYTITIKNKSSSNINDLVVSDITPSAQKIEMTSLKCTDADCIGSSPSQIPQWVATDAVLRDFAIKGLTLPANGVRTISYRAEIVAIPNIDVSIGNFSNLVDVKNVETNTGIILGSEDEDEFLDIYIKPEVSDEKVLTYFFSKFDKGSNRVTYVRYDEEVGDTTRKLESPINDLTDEEKATLDRLATEPPDEGPDDEEVGANDDVDATAVPLSNGTPESMQKMMDSLNEDLDGDMLPDSWDETPGTASTELTFTSIKEGFDIGLEMADKVINKVGEGIDSLRCSGAGCLPIPYNYAFLAPSSTVTGIAMLAVGTPNFPYFSFMYPSTSASNFRLYISPTLTLGMGVAVCAGPSGGAAQCFIAALPAKKIPFICDAIENLVSKIRSLITTAVDFINDGANKISALVSGEDSSTSPESGADTVQHNGAYGSGNSKLTFKDSVNLKIPGFPGFFTNWIDAQIDEIFTKLLDLPDFYLILPDFSQIFSSKSLSNKNMAASFNEMKNVDDFFEAIQQIPLIKLQPEEVKVNIPIINKQQIEKYEGQAKEIVRSLKQQVEDIKKYWKCDKTSQQDTICESVLLRMSKLIKSIETLLDVLESYKNLPKTLAELRFALSNYALQIVCYLDAVMDLTGGYVKRQGKIVQSWIRAIREILDQFKGWQAVLDLAIEYQSSCDECKNERYGEIGLIFQIFGSVFPDLPIIQIPKWPDFVFDFSKIEMGMTILWPDFVFKPVPLVLPDLPSITIPTIKPSVDINIPDFDISLPSINFDLPDLPPLPLPKLPDIPRPPTIPKLPQPVFDLAVSLKPIFKILCLIKKGLLIFPESKVKGQIEGMTEPGVKPVLPITLNLNLKAPSFSYDAPVEFDVTFKAKFGVDTNGIYDYVKYAADKMNAGISDWASTFNGYMKAATNAGSFAGNIGNTMMDKMGEAGISPNWSVDLEEMKVKMKSSYNFDMEDPNNLYYYLASTQDYISNNDPLLNKKASDLQFIASTDDIPTEMVDLRNSLLAYSQSFEDQGNMFENINGLEEFNTMIASLPETKLDINEKFVSKDLDQQNLNSSGSDIVVKKVSIAAAEGINLTDLPAESLAEGAVRAGALEVDKDGNEVKNVDENGNEIKNTGAIPENLSSVPATQPKGLFVVNNVKDDKGNDVLTSENVVSYTAGLNNNTKILFTDVDLDKDTDIIYTMGNDIYWKKNYEKNENNISNPDVFTISSVSDYSTSVKTSVQTEQSTGNKNNSSTLSFLPQKYSDLIGYEVAVFPSLTDIDKDVYRGTYRYLLVENPEEVLGKVDEIFGMGNLVNSVEKTIYQSPAEFAVVGGDLVYTISDAVVIFNGINVSLPAGSFYEIPSDSDEEAPMLGVALGTIEYINKDSDRADKLFTKTSFIYGDKLMTLNNGGSTIAFGNGAKISVKQNETFEITELTDPSAPSVPLNIPNGNYFAVVYSIHSDGTRSLPSTPVSVSPQICGITSAPLPIAKTSVEVAVTKVAELDASASFDPAGAGIKAYYLDMDLNKDNNGDGNSTNDPDLWSDLSLSLDGPDLDGNLTNDMTNPLFKLGPFDEVGEKQVMLNVVNNANIVGQLSISIKVYVPKIALEKVSIESHMVDGSTNSATADMPYTLMRKRYLPRVEDGAFKLISTDYKITTPTATKDGQYATIENGTYDINDFNLDEILYIKDASGNIVVEIDSKTGNFEIKKQGYKYSVYDANPPSDSGKIVFKSPNGDIVGTMYFVGDPNFEVVIEDSEEFTTEKIKEFYGVHVTQPGSENLPDDKFEFRRYPPNDPNYPDGLYLYYLNEEKQIAAVDTAGNILLLDKRATVGKKQNEHLNDPFVYIIRFNNVEVAEVYVSPKGKFDEVQIVGPNDIPKKFPNGVSPGYLFEEQSLNPTVIESKNTEPVFADLSGDIYKFALNLYKQGLIDPNSNFDPNSLISREDFVTLLLNILCIVPRAEAYTDPPAFSDVLSNPWIKEAALLGLVKGYEDYDDSTLNPFMPEKTINLAEAVFVIVNGLNLIGVIDNQKLISSTASTWYDTYMDAGLNLNKYIASGVLLKNSYIITQEESVNPESQLTRGTALEIAYRVLDAYNCTIIDKDANGMSDYCEAKYNITDPNADGDNDGLINSDECKYMTDPTNPDTDAGGVKDGDEVKLGTNPLDKIDDRNDIDGDGLTDQEELNVYNTDPNKADTDNGGINDGEEVKKNKTDPNFGQDDYAVGDVVKGVQVYETEAGVYLVPASCDSCPCNSSIEYKADLRKGDILYTVIVNKDESKIYSKSNEQKIE